jgi:two-component system OmpR family response regulator
MRLLLILSPDDALSEALQQCARRLGHSALATPTTRAAQRMLARFTPDLLCVDTLLGEAELERFWRWLLIDPARQALPVLFVAPPIGAFVPDALPACFRPSRDGQISRPIDAGRVAREVNRLLAASGVPERAEVLAVGDLTLNLSSYQLTFRDGPSSVLLTPTEFKLLRYLMERSGSFVNAEEIVERVWGYRPDAGGLAVVRAHVANVRRKIRAAGQDPGLLRTVPYRGYAFIEERAAS